jgi:competence protein ComEA
MKSWWTVTWILSLGILIGLLAGGLLLLISSPPRGEGISLSSPPTPLPLVVHVAGEVTNPGVYTLPPGSRVRDAIAAAGGLTPGANDQAINQAAFVNDGDLVRIPSWPATPSLSSAASSAGTLPAPQGQTASESGSIPININTASLAELDTLPGIGPVIAQRIITYRETNGPFQTIEAIQDVSGIGPVIFERIKASITVDALP